jgi:hypothetical protein
MWNESINGKRFDIANKKYLYRGFDNASRYIQIGIRLTTMCGGYTESTWCPIMANRWMKRRFSFGLLTFLKSFFSNN